MPSKPYEAQLTQFGLSEKEARVYIASLQLGPSAVQKIAQKSGVNRATTYVMIQSLMDRGLMSTFDKQKKSYFVAESPERIVDLLEQEKNQIESKHKLITELLPDLLAFSNRSEEKPKVLFFEGVEGLRAIHEDILRSVDKTIENIVSLDDAHKVDPADDLVDDFRAHLEKKNIHVRILYSAEQRDINLPPHLLKKWQLKKISSDKFPIHGELTVYGNKVAAFSYRGNIFGTILESREIAQTVRALFNLAWN